MSRVRRVVEALLARWTGRDNAAKWARHHDTIRRADRLIEAYRQLDLVLVSRRK